MVAALDPDGRDDALKEMVVIGHSQGGLLTKLTATETDEALVRAMTGKSLDQLELDEKERAMVERYMVYTHLPFVGRVIFISTPHRGSFLASNWVRGMVQKLISLPKNVMKQTHSLLMAGKAIGATGFEDIEGLTSVDAMSPDNPGLLALADTPLAPGIAGHSIIGIDGDEQPPEGDDGVVKYTSAHVDYVASEFIVRHGHSCQQHPLVIEEVRRILLEHLEALPKFEDR
jgi:pimeloyl-ACP methyl ester carboxylesterase